MLIQEQEQGIIGILLIVQLLHETYSLAQAKLTIGCDNMALGKHCLQHTGPLCATEDHYDFLAAASKLRKALPFGPTYRHVKGHQRTKYPGRLLNKHNVVLLSTTATITSSILGRKYVRNWRAKLTDFFLMAYPF